MISSLDPSSVVAVVMVDDGEVREKGVGKNGNGRDENHGVRNKEENQAENQQNHIHQNQWCRC